MHSLFFSEWCLCVDARFECVHEGMNMLVLTVCIYFFWCMCPSMLGSVLVSYDTFYILHGVEFEIFILNIRNDGAGRCLGVCYHRRYRCCRRSHRSGTMQVLIGYHSEYQGNDSGDTGKYIYDVSRGKKNGLIHKKYHDCVVL